MNKPAATVVMRVTEFAKPAAVFAWCWPDGQIEFGESAPEGCIIIASGRAHLVRENIARTARHGYYQHTSTVQEVILLVPGVPECDDTEDKIAALGAYLLWLKGREEPGFYVTTSDGRHNPFYQGSVNGHAQFATSERDRRRMVMTFNRYQLRNALRMDDLQPGVRDLVQAYLRKMEH
jgi:hypothetical protein